MALWIIGCSGSKHEGERAACTKYNARQHNTMLDLFLTQRAPCGDDLFILSAEHGLIHMTWGVADYDCKMDKARAAQLAGSVAQKVAMAQALEGHSEVYVYGGAVYRDCVKALIANLGADVELVEIIGENRGCGDHFSALCAMFNEGE